MLHDAPCGAAAEEYNPKNPSCSLVSLSSGLSHKHVISARHLRALVGFKVSLKGLKYLSTTNANVSVTMRLKWYNRSP